MEAAPDAAGVIAGGVARGDADIAAQVATDVVNANPELMGDIAGGVAQMALVLQAM